MNSESLMLVWGVRLYYFDRQILVLIGIGVWIKEQIFRIIQPYENRQKVY